MTPEVERYFELLQSARATHSLVEQAAFHREAVGLLVHFARDKGNFSGVTVVPCIEEGSLLLAAAGDMPMLNHLQDIVSTTPGLRRWRKCVQDARKMADIASRIFELCGETPGIVQKDLKNTIPGATGEAVGLMASRMEGLGRIRRAKSGNSLALYRAV